MRHAPRTHALVILLCLLPALPGCNIFAAGYLTLVGEGDVRKEFKLDDQRKTVVFVDDPSNRIAQRRIRAQIGTEATDRMVRKNVAPMIEANSALAAATRDRYGELQSVVQIGEAVGAEVVVHVVVEEFSTEVGATALRPSAQMRVWLIDVATQDVLWPPSTDERPPGMRPPGFPLAVTQQIEGTVGVDARGRSQLATIQRDLAQRAGEGIAQLFYDVEVRSSVRR